MELDRIAVDDEQRGYQTLPSEDSPAESRLDIFATEGFLGNRGHLPAVDCPSPSSDDLGGERPGRWADYGNGCARGAVSVTRDSAGT